MSGIMTKSNRERGFYFPGTAIALFIGIIASIITIFAFVSRLVENKGFSGERPAEDIMMYGLLVSFVFIIFYLLIRFKDQQATQRLDGEKIKAFQNKLKEAETKLGRYSSVFPDVHKILHELRNILYLFMDENDDANSLLPDIKGFIINFLNLYREMFIKFTGTNNICTSIKVFLDASKPTLRTLSRDSMSKATRGMDDATERFDVDKNTDFSLLYRMKERFFISNNLKGLNGYNNERQSWEKLYNSAAIFPIRIVRGNNCKVTGFLCVDSINTGIFDEGISESIGLAMADILYPLLTICVSIFGEDI